MFERRLKLVLLVLFLFTGLLVLRAAQVQLLGRAVWEERAEKTMQRSQTVETVRGRLLDVRGRSVAEDAPCIDACVDYRAIVRPADARWVTERARERLRRNRDPAWVNSRGDDRKRLLAAEVERVRADVDRLWDVLAEVSRLPGETAKEAADRIEEARQAIVARVEMRRRYLWFRNYQLAVRKQEDKTEQPAWERWL
ncbi:MAG TPA: hypothetical protein VK324_07490, partial [Tepidisphaeraceae bacterium]|nr:hypothetical protein [Tepidisphaeraceae bacterium]